MAEGNKSSGRGEGGGKTELVLHLPQSRLKILSARKGRAVVFLHPRVPTLQKIQIEVKIFSQLVTADQQALCLHELCVNRVTNYIHG